MDKVLVSPNPDILESTSGEISPFRVHTVFTGRLNELSLLTIVCDGRWMMNQHYRPSNSNIPAHAQGESDQTRTPQVGMFWWGSDRIDMFLRINFVAHVHSTLEITKLV